jgi:hypothetical protein
VNSTSPTQQLGGRPTATPTLEHSERFSPTFIVGCPRSGTTLLASLCDRHSKIAVTPESHFFSRFCKKWVPRGKSLFQSQELAQLFAECQYTRDFNLSPGQILDRTGRGEIALDKFYCAALDSFASLRGKSFWIEKTPEHLLYADTIFDCYPDARMICIFRDGRDVALSCLKMPWAIAPIRQYAGLWRESAVAMLDCQRKRPENFLAVRYERLLSAPQETLSEVMKFVGLEFEPKQLDATLGTGIVPEWERQVKENVFSEIDPRRACAWKQTATAGQLRVMNSMMRPYLEELGYEPGDPSSAWPVRLYDAVLNRIVRITCSHRLYWWRWWIRVLLNPVIRVSPHYSLKESRRRPNRGASSM